MTEVTVDALILDKVGKRLFNNREWAAYLFACDCLERALPFYEREFPGDMRPHRAIKIARKYADKHVLKRRPRTARNAVYTASKLIARAMGWGDGWAEKFVSAKTTAWNAAHVSEWAVANAAINPQDLCLPGIALVSPLCDDEQEESDATFGAVKNDEVEWQTERLNHYLNT